MTIAIIKKTAIAAVAVAVVATGSITATTGSANAHHREWGISINLGTLKDKITRDRGYDDEECWTEKRVRYNRYGDRIVKRVRICD